MAIVGVLTLQGGYAKHQEALEKAGAAVQKVRSAEELSKVDALVIPGGESTTIGKLLHRFNILEPLKERIKNGMPVFGTCAGMILLSEKIEGYDQFKLDALDIEVERNAYGRQIESFEAEIETTLFPNEPIKGVFIRAPRIKYIGSDVEVLANFEDKPVLVQQGKILAASFHPELTDDYRIHKYFVEMI